MFQLNFLLQNIHFVISVFIAFMFFAIFWLYAGAWMSRKSLKDSFKIIGFLFLSISFGIYSTYIESTILTQSIVDPQVTLFLSTIIRIAGYVLVILGLVTDPLQKRPNYTKVAALAVFGIPSQIFPNALFSLLPILSVVVGFLYLRKSTIGLEHHLRLVSLAFLLLSVAELCGLASIFQVSAHVGLSQFASPFGPVWLTMHVVMLLSAILLSLWVFQYLLTRIQTQLYIFFTTGIMVVFMLTTVTFTSLLIQNMQQEALNHLTTDVQMFQYAIDTKKTEILSDARTVGQDPALAEAITKKDRKVLQERTEAVFLSKQQSSLVVASKEGMVLFRAEDPERYGESISADSLFKRAVSGESLSSVSVDEGVLAPTVSLQGIVPVTKDNEVVGIVLSTMKIDNAFLDGVKQATGLDIALYGDVVRSATTFKASDGKSRWVGIKEENPQVKKTVLTEGKIFRGQADLLNVSYLTVYAPMRDADTNPLGMLLVAKEQQHVLQTAAQSMQITFIVSGLLLILSLVPAHFIARYIAYQVK